MRYSRLALSSYKHCHVYYYLINPHNIPGKLMIHRSGERGSERLSDKHRIVQWKSGRKRNRSQPLTPAAKQGLGADSSSGWARGRGVLRSYMMWRVISPAAGKPGGPALGWTVGRKPTDFKGVHFVLWGYWDCPMHSLHQEALPIRPLGLAPFFFL